MFLRNKHNSKTISVKRIDCKSNHALCVSNIIIDRVLPYVY